MTDAVMTDRPLAARVATTAAFLAAGLGIGAWAGSIASLKEGLGLSDAALGTALFAFAAGAIVSMPPTGWVLTRVPADRVMLAAAVLFALTLLPPVFAASLPMLVGGALLLGAVQGALDVSINAYATAVQRRWGAPIMSSFHAAFSIGGLLGSALMGAMLAQGLGVRGAMGAVSAATGLLAAAVGLLRRTGGFGDAAPEKAEGPSFAWPTRALAGIGALAFLTLLIEGAMADWSGVYLRSVLGAPVADAAAGYAAFSIAMACGRLTGDRAVRRLGGVRVLRFGGVAAAAGLLLGLATPSPTAAAMGFALVGIGAANIIPLLFGAAGRTPGVAPGVGVAMAATLGYAGFLSGPPVIGFLAQICGLRFALGILLVSALAVAALGAAVMPSGQGRKGAGAAKRLPGTADPERPVGAG